MVNSRENSHVLFQRYQPTVTNELFFQLSLAGQGKGIRFPFPCVAKLISSKSQDLHQLVSIAHCQDRTAARSCGKDWLGWAWLADLHDNASCSTAVAADTHGSDGVPSCLACARPPLMLTKAVCVCVLFGSHTTVTLHRRAACQPCTV
jgi:hypothetical protein